MKHILLIVAVATTFSAFSQANFETNKEGSEYEFKVIKDLEATDVQSQGRTGTCWSFSSLSFFESEIIRLNKGKHNLSEMFIARSTGRVNPTQKILIRYKIIYNQHKFFISNFLF